MLVQWWHIFVCFIVQFFSWVFSTSIHIRNSYLNCCRIKAWSNTVSASLPTLPLFEGTYIVTSTDALWDHKPFQYQWRELWCLLPQLKHQNGQVKWCNFNIICHFKSTGGEFCTWFRSWTTFLVTGAIIHCNRGLIKCSFKIIGCLPTTCLPLMETALSFCWSHSGGASFIRFSQRLKMAISCNCLLAWSKEPKITRECDMIDIHCLLLMLVLAVFT